MRISLTLTAIAAVAAIAAAPLAGVARDASVAATGAQSAFVEVAFDHAITQEDRDLLVELGASALSFAPPTGYRAYLPTDAIAALAEAPGVASAQVVPAEAKIDAMLDRSGVAPVIARVATEGVEGVLRAVEAVGGVVVGTTPVRETLGAVDVTVVLPGSLAVTLASAPGVAYVGPAPVTIQAEGEIGNAVLARLTTAGSDAAFGPNPQYAPRYEEFLAELGIDGSGVVVAIVDDGVDEEHPQLNVVASKDYASPHDEPIDGTGHGTHVAGIVGGTGATLPDAVATDAKGFEPGVGVAPGVGLTNQNLIATSGVFTNHVALFEQATRDAIGFGANIWNASWTSGEGTGVGYLASGARLDELVRDGDAQTPGLQPFTMVFSAGNSGSGQKTITAPKEAKNLIVLASVDAPTSKPFLGASNDARNVSSFSSRGPTKDGRIGITVAAPGADVRSTKSLGGGGLCFEPVTDPVVPLYSYCSGTSMASPHAAGTAALITQWWRDGQGAGADPSPALVKALMVNSAVDIKFADIPNIHEGWGRIDLRSMFTPGTGRMIRDGLDTLSDPGQTTTFTIEAAGDAPLKVTLDWLDPAGDPAAATAIVNDLDLVLVAPDGTRYLGNRFDKGWSVTGGTPDRLEVLENVFVDKPMAGIWTVEVTAHALPGDGALLAGDETDQDFTLVVTGLR